MGLKIEEGCEIHCDGYKDGKKCAATFIRYRYKSREDVMAEALTHGWVFNPKTGNWFCNRCAKVIQANVRNLEGIKPC
jgi:nitrite reductase/ring-hydroxylating ferredoxin subunit